MVHRPVFAALASRPIPFDLPTPKLSLGAMKSLLLIGTAALAALQFASAQTEPAATPGSQPAGGPVPMDKVSYFIGTNFGGQFKSTGQKLDIEQFVAGVKDALEGKQTKFSEAEMMAAMQAFQTELRAEESRKGDETKAAGAKFLADNGKREGVTTLPSGLQYEVLKKGDGPKPVATDKVNVHYHGTLTSGKVFDSSVERGMPVTFGVQEVIKGWTEALQLMPVGSKWKIYLPSDLAYGERGAGQDIGPNETLIFEVELLGIVK